MSLLSSISGPRDLDALSARAARAARRRDPRFLIENVSRTGGHLGPNLGVVELTIAMHRVFDSPNDPFIFDTGHQSYVHKLLTGRQDFTRPALARRPRRLPAAVREPARRRGVLARLQLAQLGRRRLARADPHRAQGPACRRRRRRRRAHRRHDVGGAQQHLRRQRPQPRHRRQRQRPLVRADDRRHGALPQPRAHRRHLPQLHRGSDSLFRKLGPAARALYRGVRGGTHGFLSRFTNNAALYSNLDIKYLGPVDGHDLPIAHRDPRAREGVRRPGHRARDHREGPRLPARPATTRPTSSTPSARSTRSPGEPVGGSASARRGPTSSPTSSSPSARSATTSSR